MKRIRRALVVAALLLVSGGLGAFARWGDALEELRTPHFSVPAGWPAPHYDFAHNPVTRAGFALGRKLFYDARLSSDGSVSCASCHQQFAAFAHYEHAVSHGVANRNGRRNAPGLFNLAWEPELMWDGAVHSLEVQPLAPLTNRLEMDETLDDVLARLRADADYPRAFAAAFGTPDIDSQRLLRALTQFTGTLISDDSPYDRYQRGDKTALSAEAQRGLALFRKDCASCHAEPLFTDYSYRNNGLDLQPGDDGRAAATGRAEDRGRFRVPSLRNVALTAPYMHDGRYDSLEQVLDHYATGIHASAALAPELADGFRFDPADRAALLAFLDALSDQRFIHDRRYAEARR